MKYLMVVARNNLNSQYLLIYLLLKSLLSKAKKGTFKVHHKKAVSPMLNSNAICPQVFSKHPQPDMTTPSCEPSEPLIYTSFCSHHVILYDHYLCVCLIIFPLMVHKLLVGRTWIGFISGSLTAASTQSDRLLLNEGAREFLGMAFLRKRGLLEGLALK